MLKCLFCGDALKVVLVAALSVLGTLPAAHAQFNTYSEWERQPPGYRAGYVAGALDWYWIVTKSIGTPQTAARARNIFECISDAGISDLQISDNLQFFASTHPALQSGTTVGALIDYLEVFCGETNGPD